TKASSKSANSFVIQRHDATRLHYDFRLEVNGVLKSWAIPKGPSLNPNDKRLAVMVEDHPLAYGKFKGRIPDGNYGAGIVEIWDHGTWIPEELDDISDKQVEKTIKNGMLKFSLKGKKLKGSFALVRIKGSDSKNWLLIKHRDKYATDKEYNSEDETLKSSPINKSRAAEGKRVSTKVIPASKQKAAKKTAAKKSAPEKVAKNKTPTKKSAVAKSKSIVKSATRAQPVKKK
ncbi:MAG: DNA polymerase ligase N-terminal domain-containing protein, partial [Flavitalea sp.]